LHQPSERAPLDGSPRDVDREGLMLADNVPTAFSLLLLSFQFEENLGNT
jgi:hypothetical protein